MSKPPPPPPGPKAPPPPKAPPAPSKPPPASGDRKKLLGSIESFSKAKLKKTVTNDRSAPIIEKKKPGGGGGGGGPPMGGMPMGMPMGGGPIPKKPAAKGAAPPVGRPPRPAAAASEADESPPPSLGGSIKPPASKEPAPARPPMPGKGMPLPGLGGSLRPERPERPTSSNVAQTPSPKMAADSGNRPASMNAAGTSPKGATIKPPTMKPANGTPPPYAKKAPPPVPAKKPAASTKLTAIYAYTAQQPDELTFPVGAVITLRKKNPDGWWEGEYNGKIGLFPENYVKESGGSDASNMPKVKALYDYRAQRDDEISIRKGDVITLIEKHPNGWYLGQLNGQQGLFPGNYVQEL